MSTLNSPETSAAQPVQAKVKKRTRKRLRVYFTDHALDRYIQRVRPGLSRQKALRELRNMDAQRDISEKRPPFANKVPTGTLFLRFGSAHDDSIVFILKRTSRGLAATTCLTSDLQLHNKSRSNKQHSTHLHQGKRAAENAAKHALDFDAQWEKLQELRSLRTA